MAVPADRWVIEKAAIRARPPVMLTTAHVSSSSSAFAFFKSAVLNPSVKQQ
jgi:hypothetical protein